MRRRRSSTFFDGITKSLKKGQPITFVGFGTFKTAQRKARVARNPQTGAEIKVPSAGRSLHRWQSSQRRG
jgi:DNA-binding protein HU-beta